MNVLARNNYDAFTDEYYTQYNSTISSGETRIPICFCIDVSSSMRFITNRPEDYTYNSNSGFTEDGIDNVREISMLPGKIAHERIDEVKRVLKRMLARMRMSSVLKNSAVISIVTFSRFADCIIEFSELDNISDRIIDTIKTDADQTNASEGIRMTLNRLDSLGKIIRNAGNESYKPVFIFMSDGQPTDGEAARDAGYEVRQRSEHGKLNVIPIAIGTDYQNETWLKQLTRESYVYHMEHEDEFDRVFNMITSRIYKTTAVISVDEGLETDFDEDSEGVASSRYGATTSQDDIDEFMKQLGDI